jgi:hypothetical protein
MGRQTGVIKITRNRALKCSKIYKVFPVLGSVVFVSDTSKTHTLVQEDS